MANAAATIPTNIVIAFPDYFSVLPNEILFEIFQYLGPKDLFIIAPLNKRFNQITNDQKLWFNVNLLSLNVICLHTLLLLLNKPVVHLKLQYCSNARLRKCYKPHSPPSKDQNNLLSLNIYLNRRCNRTDLNRILRRCRSLKYLSFNAEEPISFTSCIQAIAKYCPNLEVLKLHCVSRYVSRTDLRLCRDDLRKLSKLDQLGIRCVFNDSPLVSDDFMIFPPQIRKLTCSFQINTATFTDFGTDDGTGSDHFSDSFGPYRTWEFLIDDEFVAGIVTRYPNLESLHLPNCDISDNCLDDIANGLKNLKRLRLWTACSDYATNGDLSQLEIMENLQFLTIPNNVVISDELRRKIEIVELPFELCH